MKKRQVALFSLLALAAAITVGCGGGNNPTFSKLPFSSNRTSNPQTPLFLMNLDGSNVTPVTLSLGNFYSPSISADLKKIAFLSFPNVWVINSDGTGQTQLTMNTDDSADNFSYVLYAKISPNGKKILYTFWDGANQVYGVWIMNVDGTGKQNLTTVLPTDMTGCYSGSYSADSRKVTFACFGNSGNGVYLANVDGTHQSTVVPVTNAFLDTPMFSPDGKKILFFGNNYAPSVASRHNVAFSPKPSFASLHSGVRSHGVSPSTQGVFSINLDGTGATLVAPDAYEGEILNSTLYYTVYDSDLGMSQIWKANLDGSSAVTVSDGTADDRLDLAIED